MLGLKLIHVSKRGHLCFQFVSAASASAAVASTFTSRQYRLSLTLDIWESIGLKKCAGEPFGDLEPRSRLRHWLTKIACPHDKVRITASKFGSYIPYYLITFWRNSVENFSWWLYFKISDVFECLWRCIGLYGWLFIFKWSHTLHWRYNERHSVSNHGPLDCLLNRMSRRRWKKIPKLRVTGLCDGIPPVTGDPHKGPVTRKMFPLDDVIVRMQCNCAVLSKWLTTQVLGQCFHIFCPRKYHEKARISLSDSWYFSRRPYARNISNGLNYWNVDESDATVIWMNQLVIKLFSMYSEAVRKRISVGGVQKLNQTAVLQCLKTALSVKQYMFYE